MALEQTGMAAFLTKFYINTTNVYTAGSEASSVGTEVAEVGNFDFNAEGGSADTTPFNVTRSFRTFVPTVLDPGSISMDFNMVATDDPANATGNELYGLYTGSSPGFRPANFEFRLVLPDHLTEASRSYFFSKGHITNYNVSGAFDGKLQGRLTIKLSGPAILKEGTGT